MTALCQISVMLFLCFVFQFCLLRTKEADDVLLYVLYISAIYCSLPRRQEKFLYQTV